MNKKDKLNYFNQVKNILIIYIYQIKLKMILIININYKILNIKLLN